MAKGRCAAILHDTREFLRFVLIASEALRRPKDFDGLQNGWATDRPSRQSMYMLALHFGGPSLATAGVWTQLAISRVPFNTMDLVCCRCKAHVETHAHRCWDCVANQPFRVVLDAVCPGNSFPAGLPACLSRCGLLPANLSSLDLTLDQAMAIQDYLLAVNASATVAVDSFRRGKPLQLLPSLPRKLEAKELYAVALPPMKRRKITNLVAPPASARTADAGVGGSSDQGIPSAVRSSALVGSSRVGQLDQPTLPEQLDPSVWVSSLALVVSTDGSFSGNEAGWGFTVARQGSPSLKDYCGPVILDGRHRHFLGAAQHSNNVGELCAMVLALSWVCKFSQSHECVVLEYDSDYAAKCIQRLFRAKSNVALILLGRSLLDKVGPRITWNKVESHVGASLLNDRADTLAKCGAIGISRGVNTLAHTPAFDLVGDM